MGPSCTPGPRSMGTRTGLQSVSAEPTGREGPRSLLLLTFRTHVAQMTTRPRPAGLGSQHAQPRLPSSQKQRDLEGHGAVTIFLLRHLRAQPGGPSSPSKPSVGPGARARVCSSPEHLSFQAAGPHRPVQAPTLKLAAWPFLPRGPGPSTNCPLTCVLLSRSLRTPSPTDVGTSRGPQWGRSPSAGEVKASGQALARQTAGGSWAIVATDASAQRLHTCSPCVARAGEGSVQLGRAPGAARIPWAFSSFPSTASMVTSRRINNAGPFGAAAAGRQPRDEPREGQRGPRWTSRAQRGSHWAVCPHRQGRSPWGHAAVGHSSGYILAVLCPPFLKDEETVPDAVTTVAAVARAHGGTSCPPEPQPGIHLPGRPVPGPPPRGPPCSIRRAAAQTPQAGLLPADARSPLLGDHVRDPASLLGLLPGPHLLGPCVCLCPNLLFL